ncbi:MAG: CAP domain-containing protein [Eubacterium sp.]|nr:CAP domain-containing protein [Eubacterium sp.]
MKSKNNSHAIGKTVLILLTAGSLLAAGCGAPADGSGSSGGSETTGTVKDAVEADSESTETIDTDPGSSNTVRSGSETDVETAGADSEMTDAGDAQSAQEEAWQVLTLINEEREKAGLDPLIMDRYLCEAAVTRCAELPVSFSHVRPDGSSCFTVTDGTPTRAIAENIAKDYPDATSVVEGWMASEEHRDNILSTRYRSVGIALLQTEDTCYWVQEFSFRKASE